VKTELIAGMATFFALQGLNMDGFTSNCRLILSVLWYSFRIYFLYHIVISVFCGDFKKIKVSSWIIALLFIAMILLTY